MKLENHYQQRIQNSEFEGESMTLDYRNKIETLINEKSTRFNGDLAFFEAKKNFDMKMMKLVFYNLLRKVDIRISGLKSMKKNQN